MEVVRDLNGISRDPGTVLTVGTFDGIHLGHQYIIREVRSRAREQGLKTALVTFDPHPKMVVQAESGFSLKLLTSIEEKIELLQSYDLDRLIIIPFDKNFAGTSSKDFLVNLLYRRIGFKQIIIGHDHAFGKDRQGDINTIREVALAHDFTFDALPAQQVDHVVVSSTKIRRFLEQGEVEAAARILGRNYTFDAKVVSGLGRGTTMGFPTANLDPVSKDKLIPGTGVYAVHVGLHGKRMNGMMNIGTRPTFGISKQTVEVYILDFDEKIYEEIVRIHLVEKIRNEIKFENADSLIAQLNTDKQKCLSILNSDREVQCP